jgi:hypothetical protein
MAATKPTCKDCDYCGLPFIQFSNSQIHCSEVCRFWSKVSIGYPDECWLWQWNLGGGGYGAFAKTYLGYGRGGATIPAQRYSWFIHFGPIPMGLFVCHHCDVKHCVNPAHLYLGPPVRNVRDAFERRLMKSSQGEDHCRAKLTWEKVERIRDLFATRRYSLSALGREFGVVAGTISSIVKRINWKGTPCPH